ncbi:MAG: DUF1801 domain-containing protein [Planctomycetota bacterium]|nr:DUF1801 domain-containing protein [Planctomycetota bacterium]
MTAPKTQKNDASVDRFLAGIKNEQERTDCLAVLELMKEISGAPAAMWGKSIVGFGSFHYRGKTAEGDWFPIGFSPRKQNLVLYLHCVLEKQTALLEKLGKHKIGKSCLYIKRLEDIHLPTLKKLIRKAHKSPEIQGATTVSSQGK